MGIADSAAVSDSYLAEVKGPDENVWGTDRPEGIAPEQQVLGINEIRDEGTPQELKGPGPEWSTDDKGEYVNRVDTSG